MPVNRVQGQPVGQRPVKSQLEEQDLIERLKTGNIHEILSKLPDNVTLKDIQQYLGNQWRTFNSQIVQSEPIVAVEGQMAPPSPQKFSQHDSQVKLDDGPVVLSVVTGVPLAEVRVGLPVEMALYDTGREEEGSRVYAFAFQPRGDAA